MRYIKIICCLATGFCIYLSFIHSQVFAMSPLQSISQYCSGIAVSKRSRIVLGKVDFLLVETVECHNYATPVESQKVNVRVPELRYPGTTSTS